MPVNHDEFQTIDWSFDDETGIGHLVIDRPDALNAMSQLTLKELADGVEAFEDINHEEDGVPVRAVTIEGTGDRSFSVGVDLKEDVESEYPFIESRFRKALFSIESFGGPVIAKIDGYCLGGGLELALMCDFRIASERSEIGFPEIDIGIFPSTVGTTQRLPHLVGPSRAKELCMTGEFLSGTEAVADGLINAAHPHEELDEAVDDFARTLAGKAPLAIRAIKDTINMSKEIGVSSGTEYEFQAYLPLRHTEDYEEGMQSFLEDRDPEWKGK